MTVWLRHTILYTCSPFWSFEQAQAQIFFRSKNTDFAAAVAANPYGDPTVAPLSAANRKALRDAFIAEPSISNTLKAYLQTQAAQNP